MKNAIRENGDPPLPEKRPMKSKILGAFTVVVVIGMLASVMYFMSPMNGQKQDVLDEPQIADKDNQSSAALPILAVKPSGKIIIDENISQEAAWTKSVEMEEGLWLQVIFRFDEPVKFHMYNAVGDSVSEVQTGDRYFTEWNRKTWTKNGVQNYTFEIVPETGKTLSGEFIVTGIGRI